MAVKRKQIKRREYPTVTSVYIPAGLLLEMKQTKALCEQYGFEWSLSQITRDALRIAIDEVNAEIKNINERHR